MAPFNKPAERPSFPDLEESILSFWDNNQIFAKTLQQTEGQPTWVTYDGPPGTNGKPHIGHMMQSALKDLWPRYKTMRGFHVKRKAGWDTHGLPVEQTVEKQHKLKSKLDIEESFGVDKFIDACRNVVTTYKKEWEVAIRRIGRFLDFENAYLTLNREFIESDWWTLKVAHEKGLLYQGYRVLPVSPKLATPLSNHEASSNYKDVKDLSAVAMFPLRDDPATKILAWTTTPWTLVGNVALALGPDIDYVYLKRGDETLIMAASRVETYAKQLGDVEEIKRVKGADLAGLAYEPLWDFHQDREGTKWVTLADDYVTDADGTGVVHLAMYGEDDFRLIQAHDLARIQHVDVTGHFTAGHGEYTGKYFRGEGVDVDIIKDLAGKKKLFYKEKYEHSYPFCPRTDEPLIYFARHVWYLKMSALREKLLAENQKIHWVPGHIREGRFGNWLDNVVDWAISRERYWGSPIPIWRCQSCNDYDVLGSFKELQERADEPIPDDLDLHKPGIDKVTLPCESCGGRMVREPDVLDCWFNAGIMPWAQMGYPNQPGSQLEFEDQYPADFICEGLDQTRGWFYTLLATSVLAHDAASYKTVICTGLVLDENGQKMSKSVGNVVDPFDMFKQFGADACRWQVFTVNPGNNVNFGETLIREVIRLTMLPLWNSYSFFVTYANADEWKPALLDMPPRHPQDRWILSELHHLTTTVTAALEAFDPVTCTQQVDRFLDGLTNWYIRRSRRRFWKGEMDEDKDLAYKTLYTVFHTLTRLLAPFMPFISETLHRELFVGKLGEAKESVHLERWPEPDPTWENDVLAADVAFVRDVIRAGNALRKQTKLKVRQPLARLVIALNEPARAAAIHDLEAEILDELNVKQVEIREKAADVATFEYKANFKTLGQRAGKLMKPLAAAISQLDEAGYLRLIQGEALLVEGEAFSLSSEDILVSARGQAGLTAATEEGYVIALDTEVTPALRAEGMMRELVSRIQKLRKDAGLDVSDRIKLSVTAAPDSVAAQAVAEFGPVIEQECLAELTDVAGDEPEALDVDGESVTIALSKA